MFDEKIGKEYLVDTDGTSDGTQLKYFYKGNWYKEDCEECEGQVEELISKLLTFTSLDKSEYVIYERGYINGKRGCRSKNFLGENESFVTLARMHKNVMGVELQDKVNVMETLTKKTEYVLDFVREMTGLDLTAYFQKVFTLDFITLNEDRHFHNLGIIMDEDGNYRPAPIFDNGKSLLNGNSSKNFNLAIEENVKRVTARPFSGSHAKTYEHFGKGFNLDKIKAIKWLQDEEDSFYKKVLIYQLERFE